MSQADKTRLKAITSVFLNPSLDYLQLSKAIQDYKTLLLEVSGIDLTAEENRSDMHFDNGKAIGTSWAAMCLEDTIRTRQFIRGIFKAVNHLKDSGKKPIHILYAGTGPFATLVLPLMVHFSPEELQFTLLEINEGSLESVKRVISKFGFQDYIKAIEQADASQYHIKKGQQIDILISETMLHALIKEQQVPIVINLINQLDEAVILIPEKIELALGLFNWRQPEHPQSLQEDVHYKKLGKVFVLDKMQAKTYQSINSSGEKDFYFPEVTIEISGEGTKNFDALCILTDIQIFGEERIKINESGLTIPLILEKVPIREGQELSMTLTYKIDDQPGLVYSVRQTKNH